MKAETVREQIDNLASAGVPSDAFTTRMLIEQTGRGPDWCNDLIRNALKLGLAKYVGDLPVKTRIGRTTKVPHYQFINTQKGNKKQ